VYHKTKPRSVINISRIVTIHYFEYGPSFVFRGEKHDFWEMVYVDKGNVEICRDDETIFLQQGEVVFHKPNEFHSIRAMDSAPNFFVVSFVCTSRMMQYFERYKTKLDKNLKMYVSSIIREAESTYRIPKNAPELQKLERLEEVPIGGEQLIKTYLEQLLIFILRSATKKGAIETFPLTEEHEDALVYDICRYLQERTEETVRISDLCGEFGYSRSFLSRRFLAGTGETLAAYAVRCKIDRAKQLIRDSGLNFTQISALLAFENPQYFSRVFKKCTGMTPSEFKNSAHV